MYCKHCGKQIADDSKFCQHCGSSQEETTTTSSNVVPPPPPNQKKVIEIPTVKTNFSESTKRWIYVYCLWLLLNLYWLFAGGKWDYANEIFLPFTENTDNHIDNWCSYYDFSEFIVYVFGLPLIVWKFVKLIKKALKPLFE